MSTIDLLGAYAEDFMRESLEVYCNASGNLQYVGKTEPEKTIRFPRTMMQFKDGSPRALYIQDFQEVGVQVQFTFKQVADPNILALATNGDLDKTSTANHYVFLGSDPGAVSYYKWTFVGSTRDGRAFELVLRKAQISEIGDMSTGGTDYAGLQLTIDALKDETITDAKRDMAYFRIIPRTFS